MGLRPGLCAGQSTSPTPNWDETGKRHTADTILTLRLFYYRKIASWEINLMVFSSNWSCSVVMEMVQVWHENRWLYTGGEPLSLVAGVLWCHVNSLDLCWWLWLLPTSWANSICWGRSQDVAESYGKWNLRNKLLPQCGFNQTVVWWRTRFPFPGNKVTAKRCECRCVLWQLNQSVKRSAVGCLTLKKLILELAC